VARILAVVDSDHNGYITYDEFEAIFINAPELIAKVKL